MPNQDRLTRARGVYEAFASGDRAFVEQAFSDDFTFSSPLDVGLDRAGFFERCWPASGAGQTFEFVRLAELGDEVVVTYVRTGPDASRGRNTEILAFDVDDRVCRAEVYFGWNL